MKLHLKSLDRGGPNSAKDAARTRRPRAGALALALLLSGLFTATPSTAAEGNGRSALEASIVTIEVTFKDYDYFQPWNKPTRAVRKHALVTGDRELVTTAQNLNDRTLVRAQKRGRGRWYNATVTWLDYHANVAILTVDENAFWGDLTPVTLAAQVPRRSDYEVLRWLDGNLETRRADFSKFTVGEGAMSFAPRIHLELNTEINGLGWAEPVVADGQVVGITVSKGGNVCTVMPTPFLLSILQAHKADRYPGLGYFDFVWQQGENPATLDYLRLPGDPRGTVIVEVPKNRSPDYAVHLHDVILEIDGFAVDMQGDYDDPEYGHVMIEGLATRGRFAGERVPMKVWRDGKILEIDYLMPKADYAVDLVPLYIWDQEPEYLIAGGLIFQPLHQPFLRGWGDDWRRRAPFRLVYFTNESPTPDRPSLVVLSQVLPDPINVGYQEYRALVVDSVNGRRVRRLADLEEALQSPKEGVHTVDFVAGDSLKRLILDADGLPAATQRVLRRYGIPSASSVEKTPSPVAP